VVVTDSSKLGQVAFAQICPIERVHEVITDAAADRGQLAQLREAGVDVVTV
jgi:DeoR/GlpR family transcriptional regulator of sugar metabolism